MSNPQPWNKELGQDEIERKTVFPRENAKKEAEDKWQIVLLCHIKSGAEFVIATDKNNTKRLLWWWF